MLGLVCVFLSIHFLCLHVIIFQTTSFRLEPFDDVNQLLEERSLVPRLKGALSVWAVYAQFSEAQDTVLKLPVLL